MQFLYYSLAILMFLQTAAGQDCGCAFTLNMQQQGGCEAAVLSSSDTNIILSANCKITPGTILRFDSTYFVVFQRIGDNKYSARLYQAIGSAKKKIPNLGDKTTVNRGMVYPSNDSPCFWAALRNQYLSVNKIGDGNWLYLENGSSLVEGKLPLGEPFMLSIRVPPIEGYFCLLEIRNDPKEVIVYFPNNLPGTDIEKQVSYKGVINLTYVKKGGHIPPFINLSLGAGPCLTTFVGIISKSPRPLAEFLPVGHEVEYKKWDGTSVQPWEIGPGFYKPGHSDNSNFLGFEFLPGDSWAAAKLEVDVK